MKSQKDLGRSNLTALYAYTGASKLWFDGALWLIYWQHRGLSFFQIGLLEAILHVTCLMTDVPLGIFADRVGWKVALLLSSLLGVVYSGVSLFAHGFWLAALAFATRGIQITLANGSDSSIAYESAAWAGLRDNYLKISGRLFAVALISMGAAEMIGGSLASWSWPYVYLAFMAANVAAFITVLFIREPRNKRQNNAQVSDTNDDTKRHSAVTILRHSLHFAKESRTFTKWITLSAILSGFVATFAFYGQSLLLHNGWSLVGIGILSATENGLGAISSLSASKVVSRFGIFWSMRLASLLAIAGMALFAWLPGGIILALGYLFQSAAGNLTDPIVDQELNRIVPSSQRATLLSFNSTAFSLFMIIVFPLFGWLAQTIGLVHAAYVGSVVGGIAIFVAMRWGISDLR